MNDLPSVQASTSGSQGLVAVALPGQATRQLTRLAAWIDERNLAFLVISVGMIVMLLWAGSYKMTAPGAEGIAPLVSHSPLVWWHFKLFGPYVGSDMIGLTEITAAILLIAAYFRPVAGVVGGLITTVMFFTTSTMLLTTPGAIISVPGIHGMRYMSFLGLFLFKDVIALGASLYLIGYFGRKTNSNRNKNCTGSLTPERSEASCYPRERKACGAANWQEE